jgi:hypothetical protein
MARMSVGLITSAAKTPPATTAHKTARLMDISTPRWSASPDRPFIIEVIQPGWPSVTEKIPETEPEDRLSGRSR